MTVNIQVQDSVSWKSQACNAIIMQQLRVRSGYFTFHKQWQSKVNCLFEVQRAVGQHLGFQAKTLHPTGTLCKIESAQRAFGSKLQSRGYCSDLQSRDYCTKCTRAIVQLTTDCVTVLCLQHPNLCFGFWSTRDVVRGWLYLGRCTLRLFLVRN